MNCHKSTHFIIMELSWNRNINFERAATAFRRLPILRREFVRELVSRSIGKHSTSRSRLAYSSAFRWTGSWIKPALVVNIYSVNKNKKKGWKIYFLCTFVNDFPCNFLKHFVLYIIGMFVLIHHQKRTRKNSCFMIKIFGWIIDTDNYNFL